MILIDYELLKSNSHFDRLSFADSTDLLSFTPFLDSNEAFFLSGFTDLSDSLAEVFEMFLIRQLDILLLISLFSDETEKVVILNV